MATIRPPHLNQAATFHRLAPPVAIRGGRVTQSLERQSTVFVPAQRAHTKREVASVVVKAQTDQQPTSGDSATSVTTVEVDEKPVAFTPRVSDPVLQSLLDGTFAKKRATGPEDSEEEEEEAKAVRKPKRNRPKKLVPQEKAVATAWGWDGKTGRDIGALEKWLRSRGLPAQKVELQLVKEGGRGLVALQNIGKGEGILEIPADLLITPETVYSCPAIGSILKEARVPAWPALAIFLLQEAGKAGGSKWSVYIDTLPRTPPCILQWSVEEVDELLKGSPVGQQAIEALADVSSTFADLEATVFSRHRATFSQQLFTLGHFKWAFAILFSRLVRLPSLNNQLALVPWADMLNHRCEVEAHIDIDTRRNVVVFKPDRPFAAGKEVLVSYGPKSNGELLLAYGVIPATRNPHDSVPLLLALSPVDPVFAVKQRVLQRVDSAGLLSFPVRLSGWPSQLLDFARFIAAGPSVSEQELSELAMAAASADPADPGAGDRSAGRGRSKWPLQLEIEAREVMLAACQLALSGYKTSQEDDEAVLAGISEEYLEDDGEQSVRVRAAAALRCSERRIYFRTDFVLRQELRDMRQAASASSSKPAVDLGNNFGGDRGGFVDKILRRIARP